MSPTKKSNEKGALALMEEAVHMLRLAPFGVLARYYIGTLPFVLGLLYFWADMSRDAFASHYCSIASLGLALLFVWMKTWQAAFARELGTVFFGDAPAAWTPRDAVIVATKQAAIHATAPVALPIALLLTVPFARVLAFYQNATVLDEGRAQGLGKLWRRAWELSGPLPGRNHLIVGVFFLFGLFVLLNLAIGLHQAPHLLKSLLGVETVFTLSGMSAFNTTYFAVVCGLTHLCVDPLLKTVYALKCSHDASIKTGNDIRVSLKRHASTAMLVVLAIASFPMISWALPPTDAGADDGARVEEERVESRAFSRSLDESIDQVLKKREFAWRMPREEEPEEKPDPDGWLALFLGWVGEAFESVFNTLGKWWDSFWDWVEELLPETRGKPGEAGWAPSIRTIFYLLCLVVVLALGRYLLRLWQKRALEKQSRPETPEPATPDIMDENVEADALPSNRWLELAAEFMDEGAFRRGLRALYLAILAHLADHGRITIARHKSNREYGRELARRAHAEPELLRVFTKSVAAFEKAWYGMYAVSREDLDRFVRRQERIMTMVS